MLDFEPIVIDTADEPVDVEQIHLFTIDGVDYHMPAELPPSFQLEVMEEVRQQGELSASAWMLEEVLGTDAYRALLACRSMTKAQFGQINDIVADHVWGQLGDGSGNGQGPNRAARRSVRPAGSSNGRNGGAGSSTTKRTSTRTSAGSTGSARSRSKTN